MKRILWFALIILSSRATAQELNRPKLVVGVMVDQLRWDYLYRYYDRYAEKGGFKRLMKEGFRCENTFIDYAPTVTACGHTAVYSGTVPAISGITGNFWWDRETNRGVYCTEDNMVSTVGSNSALGKMSPRNLLVNTICDELRLATNFRSKVIGIALKDRGGILPAGHSANAAYWYDNTVGSWITSSYYMQTLPKWVVDFNAQKLVDKYYSQGWNLLYPANSYTQSTADEKTYEGKPFGAKFPYDLKQFIGKNYNAITALPYGNTLTSEFTKAAIRGESLGKDETTDFLAVSFSSPDYIGHTFGPNSVEAEDGLLRLDKELGELLDFLDREIGKNDYTLFLTSDHGVSEVPEYLWENKLPAGRVFFGTIVQNLNKTLKSRYQVEPMILSDDNYQIHLNHRLLDSARLNKAEVTGWIIEQLSLEKGVFRVFSLEELNSVPLPARIRKMLNNGFYPPRNGDIQVLLMANFIDAYGNTGTTHGLWNPYDSHIPLLWYGRGIRQGSSYRETGMTDIAPTIAALLHIQPPNGSIGSVIEEVIK